MKQYIINLDDRIAKEIVREAKTLGMFPEEMIKLAVGDFFSAPPCERCKHWHEDTSQDSPRIGVGVMPISGDFGKFIESIFNQFSSAPGMKDRFKEYLRIRAQEGSLKCKNCTMPLTVEDIDGGNCHSCKAPIDLFSYHEGREGQ